MAAKQKKYEVITAFRDKNTSEKYQVGSEYTHKDADRLKFLVNEGYIKEQGATEDIENEDEGEGTKEDSDNPPTTEE